MAFWRGSGGGRSLPSVCAVLYLMLDLAAGNVLLMGRNVSKSFNDVEADFTPMIRASGEDGILYLADPLNACTPLLNNMIEGSKSPFVLIVRGGCSFDDKVRNAQNAGFKAAIIYDDEDSDALVAMAGNSEGIKIYAVFISKASGIQLKTYAGRLDIELWIIPSFENSSWSIMAMSFISLLTVSVVLATCFFVHKRLRRERPRAPRVREFHGMSSRLVKAMPSLIFTEVLEDNCTSRTCAICLEDYSSGEKLRVLPCRHKFHSLCVDSWLTTWRTFCPVCKQDARTRKGSPSASESTPLLSSGAASPSCIAGLTSFHSSLATSPALPIVSVPPWSARTSRARSLSSTPHIINPCKSNNLHGMYVSRSFADPRNLSSERSHESYLISPHSLTFPLTSSSNSRSNSTYVPSSCNASPSYLVGSSSQHTYLCQCESGASILALASTQSLPR